ncbi:hypothetical protein MAMC_01664 [Methylacidimicrobium cyclopophantes]|uniref:Uncharacterized protein n=1 Tax=Methylacidimicrobium cyclopophantes TaxID=1041766 RepID=A0A5E6MH15_9BACT|nr:hypothetical protein MAMC_01664 [Methylacidimicrobium cyclopophantes]
MNMGRVNMGRVNMRRMDMGGMLVNSPASPRMEMGMSMGLPSP